jgi:hypothetical protein
VVAVVAGPFLAVRLVLGVLVVAVRLVHIVQIQQQLQVQLIPEVAVALPVLIRAYWVVLVDLGLSFLSILLRTPFLTPVVVLRFQQRHRGFTKSLPSLPVLAMCRGVKHGALRIS